jgi:hypothetical protein
MANEEIPANVTETPVNVTSVSTKPMKAARAGVTSKLALLVSFVAGAFAAWLIIEAVSSDDDGNNRRSMAPTQHITRIDRNA